MNSSAADCCPDTLTVVVGSTGIGKTQFGLQFARAGPEAGRPPGIVFDMTARGDSQSHADYARRMFGWELQPADDRSARRPGRFLRRRPPPRRLPAHLPAARPAGHAAATWTSTPGTIGRPSWPAGWSATIAFFYGNFVRGVRRAVIDGIEPVDRPSDSVQIELFEYIYHQILRKDAEWVARDLFREHYRQNAEAVAGHVYDPGRIGCLLLYTSHETTLDGLIERSLDEGDLLANANTMIHLGKIREGTHFRRAMYVSKHRGSVCTDRDHPLHDRRRRHPVGLSGKIGDVHCSCHVSTSQVICNRPVPTPRSPRRRSRASLPSARDRLLIAPFPPMPRYEGRHSIPQKSTDRRSPRGR